jgi:hypothetical protein
MMLPSQELDCGDPLVRSLAQPISQVLFRGGGCFEGESLDRLLDHGLACFAPQTKDWQGALYHVYYNIPQGEPPRKGDDRPGVTAQSPGWKAAGGRGTGEKGSGANGMELVAISGIDALSGGLSRLASYGLVYLLGLLRLIFARTEETAILRHQLVAESQSGGKLIHNA